MVHGRSHKEDKGNPVEGKSLAVEEQVRPA